jgi:hypothetical protein
MFLIHQKVFTLTKNKQKNLKLILIVEDTCYDVIGRQEVRHGIGAGGKLHHQLFEAFIIAFCDEVQTQGLRKLTSVVELDRCQSVCCS